MDLWNFMRGRDVKALKIHGYTEMRHHAFEIQSKNGFPKMAFFKCLNKVDSNFETILLELFVQKMDELNVHMISKM